MDSFCKYLNKIVNSNLPRKQSCSKEKPLCKRWNNQEPRWDPSTALNTISAKSNIQHLNSLNQANFSLPSKNLNQHSHNTKQLVSQEQQHPPIPLPRTLQLKEILHPIQTHHQRLERNITTKSKYLSNLLEDIAKQNICEFFGLNSACCSPDTCNKRFPYK